MKSYWALAVGLILSIALLWWAFHNVAVSNVQRLLLQSNWMLFAFSIAVSTCIFPLRALRLRYILEPCTGRLQLGPLLRSTAVGMMINNIFPFRLGELARVMALSHEAPKVAIVSIAGSLAVERLFDTLVILGMMFGALLDSAFPAGADASGFPLQLVGIVGISVLLIALAWPCFNASKWSIQQQGRQLLVSLFGRSKATWVFRIVDQVLLGLGALRQPRLFLTILWLTIVHWILHVLGLYVSLRAMSIELPFSAALFVQGVLSIGAAIPSSPGSFGVFEALGAAYIEIWGIDKDLAVSWAILYHICTLIPSTILGAMCFTQLGLRLTSLITARNETS